jgi:hypothetical protein
MSTIFAGFAVCLLIASPWVVVSATWALYCMGVASLTLAAIFYLSND